MSGIIIAVLIITGIGVLGAIILVAASVFFHVEEDTRVTEITGILPGANCGACGYAGCADYAKAIVTAGAPVNKCIPGGKKTADAVGAVMGVQSGKVEQPKAFVACQGSYDNTSDKYKYEGISSCKACNALYSGPTLCRYGCLGYGDCTRVCKFDAIRVVNGVAKVDREKCTGCGACAKVCPDGIIHMIPENEKPVVMCANRDKGAVTRKNCSHGCIGCKKCEKLCPNGAITVTDNVAFIDMEKCDGCLKCMEGCPVKAINVPPKTCDFQ